MKLITPAPAVTRFTENFKAPKRGETILFDAQSYMDWASFVLPQMIGMKPLPYDRSRVLKEAKAVGQYYFYVRRLEPVGCTLWGQEGRSTLPMGRKQRKTYCAFTDAVDIPIVCNRFLDPIMSLTPSEVLTLRSQVRLAHGQVAIAGLGMGWLTRRVLDRTKVEHVTVVEKDPGILAYFGEPIKQQYGDRVTLVCADAYEFDYAKHDVVLWDIWYGYSDSNSDPKFHQIATDLIQQGKVCTGWGYVH